MHVFVKRTLTDSYQTTSSETKGLGGQLEVDGRSDGPVSDLTVYFMINQTFVFMIAQRMVNKNVFLFKSNFLPN